MPIFAQQKQHRSINRPALWNFLKLVLAVALAGFILSKTSFAELVALWQRISISWLLINALALYTLVWAMARRYWILLGKETGFHSVLSVVVIQTIVGNLVATSAGAISYLAILRGKHQLQIGRGIGSLVLARFGDLLALLPALLLSSWIVWAHIAVLHWLLMVIIIGLSGIVAVCTLVIVLRGRIVNLIARLLRLTHLDRINLVRRLSNVLAELANQNAESLRTIIGPFLGYSGLTLALIYLFAYSSFRIFALAIDPWQVLFVLTLTQLIVLIPIQVFGGLGVTDVTSLYLYALFGVSQPTLVPILVGSRILFYLMNLLLLLYLPLDTRLNRNADTEPFNPVEGEAR
jgi:uncharacterized membrane protein YbhN (UPF0104 family)